MNVPNNSINKEETNIEIKIDKKKEKRYLIRYQENYRCTIWNSCLYKMNKKKKAKKKLDEKYQKRYPDLIIIISITQ